jgi:hypothetical protein
MVSRSSFLGKIPHGHIKLGAELTEDLHLFISVIKKLIKKIKNATVH